MKSYYKHEAESNVGIGVVYFEFDGIYASKQLEIYGDRWFCSHNTRYHPEIGPALCDQPLSVLGLTSQHKISREEFEDIWNKALKKLDI